MDRAIDSFGAEHVLDILLVERDDAAAAAIERALGDAGFVFRLERARIEAEFHERVSTRFDIVIADWRLSARERVRAAELMRRGDIDVPLVFISDQPGGSGLLAREPYLIQVLNDIRLRKAEEQKQRVVAARLARAHRVQQLVLECNRALAYEDSEPRLLDSVCRALVQAGGYQQAAMVLANEGADGPVVASTVGHRAVDGGTVAATAPPADDAVVERVLRSGMPELARTPPLACYTLPLHLDGRCVGVLSLATAEPGAFSEDESGLLITLARDLAFGLGMLRREAARARAEAQLARTLRARRVIAECNHALVHAVDEPTLLEEACRILVESGGYAQAWIAFATGNPERPVRVGAQAGLAAKGGDPLLVVPGGRRAEAMAGVLRTGVPLLARDVLHVDEMHWDVPEARRLGYQSAYFAPLIAGGRVFAGLGIHAAEPDAFDAEELQLVTELAGDLAFGIAALRTRVDREYAERQLRLSEQRYRETLNQAAVGIVRVSTDGVLTDVNRKFCDLLGYEAAGLIGRRLQELTHPDDAGHAPRLPRRAHGDGPPAVDELRLLARDGRVVWVRRTMSLGSDTDGRGQYVVAVIEDISAAKALEQRFEATFNQAAVGLLHTSLDHRVLLANRRLCDMLGYAAEELVQRPEHEFYHPLDAHADDALEQRLVAGEVRTFSLERRYRRKDGRALWCRRTVSLARDAADVPRYFIAVLEDITDRKDAEECYRATVEQAPVGILHTATDGRVLQVNPRFCDLVGYGEDDVKHLGYDALVVTEDLQPGRAEALQRLLQGRGGSLIREERLRRRDGTTVWVSSTLSVVRDSAREPQYLVRMVEDVSERKGAQEALLQSERIAHATMDALSQHICVVDPEGTITAVNKSWRGFATAQGYAASTVWEGRNFFASTESVIGMTPAEQAALASGIREVIAGAREEFIGEYASHAGGGERWYAVKITRFRGASARRAVVSLEDVTERTVSQRRRAMEHAVATVLAGGDTLAEAMPRLIRTMCEAMNWAYGALWIRSPDQHTLRRVEYWCDVPLELDPADRHYWEAVQTTAAGGLIRRSLDGKEPVWIADVQADPTFRRQPSARRLGLASAYAFPILAAGDVIGMMEFFGRESRVPDDMLLLVTRAVGSQIGQYIRRKEAEEALRQSEAKFAQLASNIPQVFWMGDVAMREVVYVSPACEDMLGVPVDVLMREPRRLVRAVHPEDRARVHHARKGAALGQYDETYRVVRPDGAVRWVQDRAFPVRDAEGRVYRIAGIAEDITARKEAEEKLVYLAHYDTLTGLPNRNMFYDRLTHAIAQARRRNRMVAVLFLDLDRFKVTNDTLGHSAGDDLLRQVAQRLSERVRVGDTVGRFGGDEFGLILSDLRCIEDAEAVAEKIMEAFGSPFTLGTSEVYVSGSIGISLYPADSSDESTLMKNADAAMYRAKEAGRNNFQFYTAEMNERALHRMEMEHSLRRALERREFRFHYQPKVELATGRITGVEALLRWVRPGRGMVHPIEFIPLMEDSGLIISIGEWLIDEACRQIKAWERAGLQPVPVAINLSARQFAFKDLGPTIRRVLEANAVAPELLQLELTESSLMASTEDVVETLRQLKSLGVHLSIDDFGTGYSSLAYLQRFPIDALKIDRSFMSDIASDRDDATIVRAVIGMAHNLGLKVVAEGVENEVQLSFLMAHGCDEMQGYYYSPPLEGEACTALLLNPPLLWRERDAVWQG